MQKNDILLSSGSFPWMGIKQIIVLAKETGFDGLELVPTRMILNKKLDLSALGFIKSIHHNWRLDIGQDKNYTINAFRALIYLAIRLIFFPSVSKSRVFLQYLSKTINCPVTVHGILPKWTKDNYQKGFKGGILYEIMDTTNTKRALREWLNKSSHFIVVDARDDQSLLWAKKYGFRDWMEFWTWIGLKKIKGIQVTFIGTSGIKKILQHKETLPEKELIWMHRKKWTGNIIIEVNPLSLFISNKGNLKDGLRIISSFARQTLTHGKKWSY